MAKAFYVHLVHNFEGGLHVPQNYRGKVVRYKTLKAAEADILDNERFAIKILKISRVITPRAPERRT